MDQEQKMVKKATLSRDKARIKLWKMRRRIKLKVELNEEKMEKRKKVLHKKRRFTFVSFMPPRSHAKMMGSSSSWSSIPSKPRYSRVDPEMRVYGRRFRIWEKEIESRTKNIPKDYRDAAIRMAESVVRIQKEILERSKSLGRA